MSELNNVHSILNLSDELEQGKFSVDYIMDENKNCVGISHPDWPFTIMRNHHNKCETAIVCNNTDEPFGVLDSDVFNTILMSWLLIDDPKLVDEAKIDDEWISVDDRLPDNESGYNVRVYCHDIVSGWQQDLLFNGKIWIHDGGKEFEPIVTHWKPHSKNPK